MAKKVWALKPLALAHDLQCLREWAIKCVAQLGCALETRPFFQRTDPLMDQIFIEDLTVETVIGV
ncbi:MAG: hypothetical protein MI750_07640, partial [Xanthomonadales bacterium]|nr:hypothetical protein [Xanthomonadales bacterium]